MTTLEWFMFETYWGVATFVLCFSIVMSVAALICGSAARKEHKQKSELYAQLIRPSSATRADICDQLYPGNDITIYDGERYREMSHRGHELWITNMARKY